MTRMERNKVVRRGKRGRTRCLKRYWNCRRCRRVAGNVHVYKIGQKPIDGVVQSVEIVLTRLTKKEEMTAH